MATKDRSGVSLKLSKEALHKYLSSLYKGKVEVCGAWRLGDEKSKGSGDLKGFGCGFPYVIEFTVDGEAKRVVLEIMRPEGFGHDHFSDRAQVLLWQNSTFNRLPCHVHSIDIGAFATDDDCLHSLGKCNEFFILTEFVEGKLYHADLNRIKKTGQLGKVDEQHCLALSDYLVEIHKTKREAPWLYVRRIRDLVGHGECIMGLLDSYPPELKIASESYLIDVERDSIIWRWRLKRKAQSGSWRLSPVECAVPQGHGLHGLGS
jgi:hypothetical protein